MLVVCVVQCTSCAECEEVLVACATNAAPILKEWVMGNGLWVMGKGQTILPISRGNVPTPHPGKKGKTRFKTAQNS